MTPTRSPAGIYRVQVLDRAVAILQVLADAQNDLALVEIAERLDLHKSTTHRLLMVLEQHRLVRKNGNNGRFALGLRLFDLGSQAVARLRLREQARPFLERLVHDTGETAHIGVLDDGEIVSIANVEGPRTVRTPSTVGRRTAVHCSAVGKAVIAFLPQPALEETLARRPLRPFTSKTLVTRTALLADLRQVRVRGYAIDNEEIEKGLRCVGAPVRDYSDEVIAALSIAGPAFRITMDRIPVLARSVRQLAQDLSAQLGYRGSGREASVYVIEHPDRRARFRAERA